MAPSVGKQSRSAISSKRLLTLSPENSDIFSRRVLNLEKKFCTIFIFCDVCSYKEAISASEQHDFFREGQIVWIYSDESNGEVREGLMMYFDVISETHFGSCLGDEANREGGESSPSVARIKEF